MYPTSRKPERVCAEPVLAQSATHAWQFSTYRIPRGKERRLAVCLSVALVIHLLIFGLIKSTPIPSPHFDSPQVLQWVSLPSGGVAAHPAAVEGASYYRPQARVTRSDRGLPSVPSKSNTARNDVEEPRATDYTANLPHRGSAELMESGQDVVREMVREQESRSRGNSGREDRPFLPELDRALKKASVGEKYLGNGIVQITTKSGRVYCLQAHPDFTRGGPVEMLSIPTNCP